MGHDMEALVWETAEELDKKLAERMRRIRRRRKVSQQKLSDMSGVVTVLLNDLRQQDRFRFCH